MSGKASELAVRKPNSPLGRTVCWSCGRFDRPLKNLRDEAGRKTEDYACIDPCAAMGRPRIGNVSFVRFVYRGEAQAAAV